jgi:hypothetical protein
MSLSIRQNNFTIVPQNLTEAIKFADLIANSSFCPIPFKGKSGDVLIAMQMGSEVGLSPMQAIQNISVINGRPTIWGDGAMALVVAHPHYVCHREWMEGSIEKGTLTAYCSITRVNSEEYVKSFSIEDAKAAGLWSKQGVWKSYPGRMLQMRARGFAIRDKFPDALKGIQVREEVQDYQHKNNSKIINMTSSNIEHNEDVIEDAIDVQSRDIQQDIIDISWAKDIEELQKIYVESYRHFISIKDQDSVKKIISAKDKRKSELEEYESIDTETGEVTE